MRRSALVRVCLLLSAVACAGSLSAEGQEPTPATAEPGPQPPETAATLFDVAADLRWEQVLAEPVVAQPVSLSFDERGRMWVVQYLQYPFPAGLKIVSRDNYWRTVYDKTPLPPSDPGYVRGADKITIHEDTNGDGTFDAHKTFVDGLNITTAVEIGRGGVWVLNPPYLLFYPDENRDDVPDSLPEVHLTGFGIEDTHSVANSLTWGPDGWLYGAQGSTVSAKVLRPGMDLRGVPAVGQNIWRYHPKSRRFEIFAEGGGNAFGLEIDSQGRIFSGHNGGDTRGFHYVQGGYYQKGFSKHGALSNPYAYGYFPQMASAKLPRFTHDILRYEADALPEKYRGGLFGVAPLQSELTFSELIPNGSTFRTEDVSKPVKSRDPWFRPVAMTLGPDGSIYVCDWYDKDVSHLKTSEGRVDDARGRIYRLRGKDSPPAKLGPDFTKLPTTRVAMALADRNRAVRQTALRVLADRREPAVVPLLAKVLANSSDRGDLDALWGIYLSGGWNDDAAIAWLKHKNPAVREWAARLIGDDENPSEPVFAALLEAAKTETNVETRSQMAASAKFLPGPQTLRLVLTLAAHDEDASDPHIPLLLWWAIEEHCFHFGNETAAAFAPSEVWAYKIVREHLAQRLMRRFAEAGRQDDLLVCAKLIASAPDLDSKRRLAAGFEQAFEGRSIAGVPDELLEALGAVNGDSLVLKLRQGREDAVDSALSIVADVKAPLKDRLKYLQIFGQIKEPKIVPVALALLAEKNEAVQTTALSALQAYDGSQIGETVAERYPQFAPAAQSSAQALVASRSGWAKTFLEAAVAKRIDAASTPLDVRRKFLLFRDERIDALVKEVWGAVGGATTAQMEADAKRLTEVIAAGHGSPYEGKKLYRASCGKCHLLFDDGGKIGPDLTSYQRDQTANLVMNVVNPSAAIREGFEGIAVETVDGRSLAGFQIERNERLLVLRGLDGRDVTLEIADVAETSPLGKSLMPEGLLASFSDQQVRDLFAYLRSTQPLND